MRFIQKMGGITALLFLIFASVQIAEAKNSYGWGFKKNDQHELPDIGEYGAILEGHHAYYADKSGEKNIYLTFDNGYEQGYTGKILDVLEENDVPATFFVTGQYVEDEPELVKRMVDEGHIIGNHTYHHPDLTEISKASMKKELESVEKAVAAVSSQKDMQYLRAPSGTFNEQSLKWADELGYIDVFWSLAFVDWNTDRQSGWKYAYEQIMDQIHPGAIILLHTVSQDNAEALSHVITDLKEKGYAFKSLDDLVIKDMMPEWAYGF